MRYPKALINLLMYRANSLGAHFLLWLVQSLRPNVSDSILHSLERVGAPPVLRMVPVGWRYSEVVKRRILLDQSISIRLPEIGPLAAEEYSWPNRYLWELHNVTLDVTSGYIFARNHVLDTAANRYRSARDAAFISGSARRIQSATKSKQYAGEVATLGDTHHHYHFLVETLPRILYIVKHVPDVKFLKTQPVLRFAKETMCALGVSFEVVPEGITVTARSIITTDQSPYFWPSPGEIKMLQEELKIRGLINLEKKSDTHDLARIYISRSRSRRSATNESDIESVLKDHGVDPISLQDFSFVDQLQIVNNNDEIIGLHGAGMTNLIFMARGSRVTEITSGEEFEECYRRLALVCGLEYRLLVIPSSVENQFGEANEILNLLT